MNVISIHWGFSFGGVAKYAATIDQVRNRIPVEIYSLCFLPEGRIVDRDALSMLDATIIPVKSVFDVSWISTLKSLIAEKQPDCVVSHGFNGHLLSLIGCAGQAGKICRLATYHGSYHAPTTARKLAKPIFNGFTHWFMRNKASSVLNVAQYSADFLKSKGVPSSKLSVVHNGIPDYVPDTRLRDKIRSEWGFSSEHTLIGIASRLDPIKGLEYLIEAFSDLASRFPDARLVLMGDGIMRATLEARVERLGITDQLLFAGMRSDVQDCLSALDIFALPSLAESHSIGLLEAMRAGLPIVATDVGGNTESVRHEQEGLIVQSANASQLAESLDRLLSDSELSTTLSHAARERFVQEFTEEAMLSKTAAWLQRVCKN